MAWAEAALEEMGLAQIWVRRGQGRQGSAAGDAVAGAMDDAAAATTATTATAVPADVAQAAASPAQRATRSAQPAQAAQPVQAREDATRVGAAMPSAEADRAPHAAAAADHASMPATSPASASDMPLAAEDDFAWFDATPPGDPLPPAEMRADVAPVATLDWDALAARVAGCTSCRLCEKRTQTVFGVGDREADWMLIGEAPGENEDKQGEPFVGQAGKLLDNMLQSLTLARGTNVYIANVIKCRPPGNRNPEPDEVARCEPYLQRQVALVKPKLIVALGRFAAQTLLKTDASIASLRGRVHAYEGVPVIVTYHPAYLLRSLQDKSKAWADLCLARDTFRQSAATDASGPAGR
ncbi:uracil-DNA glycosylase [Burkholderia vietnamiensis]|uniref:uracil-DNA glycosylase n=1 Tax=Burkholderia vietnamiensis TaxID=60552 RepID=UPI0015942F66|nr:uracil-DNA glycosylase [Burkholderia vietnamiensis]MCA7947777.1 uracil-DNA glycosylase [Burkholderia vietnamiensis]HDR8974142.1 uracil-DNA glycosylase [Burkholderia vietnamiensis]HDR9143195.1 uracil-DNA glycosylase [Burkholderia vietnamiensis]HDR9222957.1 uracil-DNA glycosylase [Burkholderia vietnamiensis]